MTDQNGLRKAAEAVIRSADRSMVSKDHSWVGVGREYIEVLRAELQRGEPEVVSDKSTLGGQWRVEGHRIGISHILDVDRKAFAGLVRVNYPHLSQEVIVGALDFAVQHFQTCLGPRAEREETEVELPFKLSIRDAIANYLRKWIGTDYLCGRNIWTAAEALVALANRAAPQEAGRELAEMVKLAHRSNHSGIVGTFEGCRAPICIKAREVLGGKEGE